MTKPKYLLGPQRMRFEATVVPVSKGATRSHGFRTDKKITALRVLMKERFGVEGERAVRDWLIEAAFDQEEDSLAKTWGGGGDAA